MVQLNPAERILYYWVFYFLCLGLRSRRLPRVSINALGLLALNGFGSECNVNDLVVLRILKSPNCSCFEAKIILWWNSFIKISIYTYVYIICNNYLETASCVSITHNCYSNLIFALTLVVYKIPNTVHLYFRRLMIQAYGHHYDVISEV